MTIVVAYNGVLASDSLCTDEDGQQASSLFKILPLTNITFPLAVGESDPVTTEVIAVGISGDLGQLRPLIKMLRSYKKKEAACLKTILRPYDSAMAKRNMSALFLLADGSAVVVKFLSRRNDQLHYVHFAKNAVARIGCGAQLFPNVDVKALELLSATELAYITSRFSDACGDVITYFDTKKHKVAVYSPTDKDKQKLLEWIKTHAFD